MIAKYAQFEAKDENILGTKVTFIRAMDVLPLLTTIAKDKLRTQEPFFVITANPEFLLHKQKDNNFSEAVSSADLILPDGIALTMGRYFNAHTPTHLLSKLILAGDIFFKSMTGQLHSQTVPGIELVRELLQQQELKVFLLGGWDNVVERLGKKYHHDYYQGPPRINDASPDEIKKLFGEVEKSQPDVLLVSYGHFKQEKWIHEHLSDLHTKIVMGVGSSFNEILGEYGWKHTTPKFISHMGLKWLWRTVVVEPSNIQRLWNAVIVFPWTIAFGNKKGKV